MKNILTDLFTTPILNEQINIYSIIAAFLLSAILTFIISLIYKRLNRGRENLYLMMQSLIILSITIAAAMMIVGNELARAFGLVGAVSVIRFRTAVQNYRDMAFVFVAIVIGMACGLQFYLLATIVGVGTGGLLLFLGIINYGKAGVSYNNYILRIDINNNDNIRKYIEEELVKNAEVWKFIGVKTDNKRSWFKYQIQLKDNQTIDRLMRDITGKFPKQGVVIRILLATK
jgi:uncharacterized membrane protein YhiD involved in acid resistance